MTRQRDYAHGGPKARFRRPTVVLFDLDGTLIDTMPAMVAGFNAVLADRIGRAITAREVAARLGPRLTEILEHYVPGQGTSLAAEYERAYAAASHRAVPFPGIIDVVARLRADGVRTAVVTSKRTVASATALRSAGLWDAMELVVAEEDVSALKPSPEPILQALHRLGGSVEQAWMIGDSAVDLEASRAANVRFAAALWGYFPQVFVDAGLVTIERPSQIASLVLGDG